MTLLQVVVIFGIEACDFCKKKQFSFFRELNWKKTPTK